MHVCDVTAKIALLKVDFSWFITYTTGEEIKVMEESIGDCSEVSGIMVSDEMGANKFGAVDSLWVRVVVSAATANRACPSGGVAGRPA